MGTGPRAITLFHDLSAWKALMRHHLTLDFSWESVRPQYLEFYPLVLEKGRSLNRNAAHDYEN
jgi:glycogen synthase